MIFVTRRGKGLAHLAARIGPILQQEVDAASERVAAGARSVVPVKTGRLKASIQAEPAGILSAVARTDVPYAGIVEMGSTTRPAKPYLRPAAFAEEKTFPREVAKAITRAAKG